MVEIDGKTVKALVRGDESAYNAVVTALYRPVRRFALHLCCNEATADDITQETFLAVWNGITTFKGKSRFTSWVFGIAYRQHLQMRDPRHAAAVSLDECRDGEASDDSWNAFQSSSQSSMVQTLLERLPDIYWEVVFLVHIQGLTYREASGVLSIPIGTVKP
jgi:RNA polymerase sigma-70 factor, ECF subfamily